MCLYLGSIGGILMTPSRDAIGFTDFFVCILKQQLLVAYLIIDLETASS